LTAFEVGSASVAAITAVVPTKVFQTAGCDRWEACGRRRWSSDLLARVIKSGSSNDAVRHEEILVVLGQLRRSRQSVVHEIDEVSLVTGERGVVV
jgi:hypothetical protein